MSRSLHQFAEDLRRLPRVVAIKVAEAAAPAISDLAKATFDSSETPDGVPWKPGKQGERVTLHKSGSLERFLRYVAIGAKLRVSLGVRHAKWQIGARNVYPRQGALLPKAYVETLQDVAVKVVREELHR